jgi:hypothetical protein
LVVCRVRADVNTPGEEPRWPVIENQALTGLPLAGHGPDTAKTVHVRLRFHGFSIAGGRTTPGLTTGKNEIFRMNA